jgi:hypothetical protein
MKRNPKPFSVEIKKTRIPGQRSHLPSKPLFAAPRAEPTMIVQKDEPEPASNLSAATRILPSIVEPEWSSSEPAASVRLNGSSVQEVQRQMEFNLDAGASEAVTDRHAEAPVSVETVPQASSTPVDAEDAVSVDDVETAQGERVGGKSRKPRKKTSEAVEQSITSEPTPEADRTALQAASLRTSQRRMMKRLVAAAQLPRHERWKGRLHPAAW